MGSSQGKYEEGKRVLKVDLGIFLFFCFFPFSNVDHVIVKKTEEKTYNL